MPKILEEKIVFNNTLVIEEGTLENKGKTFERKRINREDGAAVLVFNTDSHKIILTRQFRYAIASKVTDDILELLAGKVDKGYTPIETAVKETREEIGYEIEASQLKPICACYISPGYTSEFLHLYYCEVTDKQKVNKGGGLASENEEIIVVEMEATEFLRLAARGELVDAKTMMAGLWLQNQVFLAAKNNR
jgi:nudix-type nucleoside diphosphatase (YffH/AdpP family)